MGIIFTKSCVLCGKTLGTGTGKAMLCPDCAIKVRQKYRCQTAVHIADADDAAAALYYFDAVRQAMLGLKFYHKQHYADWFAAQTLPLLAERLEIWQPDLITFAPIGMFRFYQRGYNQAELLAKAIAQPFSLPCLPTLKKRPFSGKQSAQKDAAARQRNAKRLFSPLRDVELSNKSVIFVDDIITTGATADAACRLLRQMGAAHVYVLAAAFTPRQ